MRNGPSWNNVCSILAETHIMSLISQSLRLHQRMVITPNLGPTPQCNGRVQLWPIPQRSLCILFLIILSTWAGRGRHSYVPKLPKLGSRPVSGGAFIMSARGGLGGILVTKVGNIWVCMMTASYLQIRLGLMECVWGWLGVWGPRSASKLFQPRTIRVLEDCSGACSYVRAQARSQAHVWAYSLRLGQVQVLAKSPPSEQCAPIDSALQLGQLGHRKSVQHSVVFGG